MRKRKHFHISDKFYVCIFCTDFFISFLFSIIYLMFVLFSLSLVSTSKANRISFLFLERCWEGMSIIIRTKKFIILMNKIPEIFAKNELTHNDATNEQQSSLFNNRLLAAPNSIIVITLPSTFCQKNKISSFFLWLRS